MEAIFYHSPPCVHAHIHSLLNEPDTYVQIVQDKADKGTLAALSSATKVCVLVALHATKNHRGLDVVLPHCEAIDLAKAVSILDLPREIRQLEKKIAMIELAHPHLVENKDETLAEPASSIKRRHRKGRRQAKATVRVKTRRRKIDQLRRRLQQLMNQLGGHGHSAHAPCANAHQDTAVAEVLASASVSGSLARKIRQWARRHLTADFLEFVMLAMPTDNWKKLADVVHFEPNDFAVNYFLAYVHGAELPEDCFVRAMKDLCAAPTHSLTSKFEAMAAKFPQTFLSYTYLRTQTRIVAHAGIAEALAQGMPLSTAIWYLEELSAGSRKVVDIVVDRARKENWLHEESKVTKSYGKLMERILTFQARGWPLAEELIPVAQSRLDYLKEKWYVPTRGLTVVFGDASASMSAAIQAATILATMVSAAFSGELSFFNGNVVPSPYLRPETVEQTLEICRQVRACGCTSLAAALWPYYNARVFVERIVMVSDEGENTRHQGLNFAETVKKYKDEVNPNVQLILVSVGCGSTHFRQTLENQGIQYRRVEIDGARADLSKFDSLLGSFGATPSVASNGSMDGEQFVLV